MRPLIAERIAHYTDPAERIGAHYVPGKGTYVRLWAPYHENVEIIWTGHEPQKLIPQPRGYHIGFFPAIAPGARYMFRAGGEDFPDPASRHQPENIFGPSEVLASEYEWADTPWRGLAFDDLVIYELHVGTFSAAGDFSGLIADLPRLYDLGVTALEIMPLTPFSGARNWGYDGVFPHAVTALYGGPQGFKDLVNAAHQQGLGIILDVVYNHLGPEGNVLFARGPYEHASHETAWGQALNFDSKDSEEVRRYLLQSVWQWLIEYRVDGLRLDAVQKIVDTGAVHFLEEVSHLRDEVAKITGHRALLIAESNRNDPRLIAPFAQGGYNFDAHWLNDFHHNLHATLTGEHEKHFSEFGGLPQLARIYQKAAHFDGKYSAFYKTRIGRPYDGVNKARLLTYSQNHDQIGNRPHGERLAALAGPAADRLAAAALLLSPFTPLLFMGQEWGSLQPFHYFVDYHDPVLKENTAQDREKEWGMFNKAGPVPAPHEETSFTRSILPARNFHPQSREKIMQDYIKNLIVISKEIRGDNPRVTHDPEKDHIHLCYETKGLHIILSFNPQPTSYDIPADHRVLLRAADFDPDHQHAPAGLAAYEAIILRRPKQTTT